MKQSSWPISLQLTMQRPATRSANLVLNPGLVTPSRARGARNLDRPDLLAIFNDFNHRYFNNEIPRLSIGYGNANMKVVSAFFQKNTSKYGPRITVSWEIHKSLENALDEVRDSVLHEMVHASLWFKGFGHEALNHGERFREELKRVSDLYGRNLTIDHPSAQGVIDGFVVSVYQCQNCGRKLALTTRFNPSMARRGHNVPDEDQPCENPAYIRIE